MKTFIFILSLLLLSIQDLCAQKEDEIKRLEKRLEECEAQTNQARNEAAVYKLAAEKAEKEIQRQRYLAIASALADKSIEINDKELAALLAVQAYNFNSKHHGYEYNNNVYSGLTVALKRYDSLTVKSSNSQSLSKLLSGSKTDSVRVGRDLIIANDNGELSILTNGIVRRKLAGHQTRVKHIEISPSGKSMVTADKDATLRVWNFTNLSKSPLVIKENAPIEAVSFSADETQIIVRVQKQKSSIHTWPLSTETMAKTLCSCLEKNMTLEEWQQYVAKDFPYESTCSRLPRNDK